jgi:hypothetical protein
VGSGTRPTQKQLKKKKKILEFQEKFLWVNIYANTEFHEALELLFQRIFGSFLKAPSNGKGEGFTSGFNQYITFDYISVELLKIAL